MSALCGCVWRPEIPSSVCLHEQDSPHTLFHTRKSSLHIQQPPSTAVVSGERTFLARLCALFHVSSPFFLHPHHEISTKQKLLIRISLARAFVPIRCASRIAKRVVLTCKLLPSHGPDIIDFFRRSEVSENPR